MKSEWQLSDVPDKIQLRALSGLSDNSDWIQTMNYKKIVLMLAFLPQVALPSRQAARVAIHAGKWEVVKTTVDSYPPMPDADIQKGRKFKSIMWIGHQNTRSKLLKLLDIERSCKVKLLLINMERFRGSAQCDGSKASFYGSFDDKNISGYFDDFVDIGRVRSEITGRYIGE